MSEFMNRMLGDSFGCFIVKLIVVLVIVGFVMCFFGWYLMDILYWICDFFINFWCIGFCVFGEVGDYFFFGVVVVVFVFIILCLMSYCC